MPHFVDYFVVCGLHSGILDKDSLAGLSAYTSPLCRSYSCKVLAHYPQKQLPWNPFDESAIRTLCMPEGLIFKKNLERPNKTHFHSFLITRENGSQAYASVLTFYEQVQDPAMLSTLDALQRSFLQTRMVTLNSADNESAFDPNTDKLYAPKCLCFVTCKPVVRPCRAYLEQLHAVTTGGKQASGGLPIESFLYNILYEVPLPSPGKTTKFTGPLGRFSWSRPSKNDLPLCDYSFREFFQLLGIRNVFKLLTCVLLEHQILLKSADYERLMLCSNCATALLFPFTWPHVFVPILPASQRGFLDAPVPYIMGLRVDPDSIDAKYLNLPNVASLCTVDIDCGKVEFPDELPCLPNEDRLLVQVSEKLHQHNISCSDMVDLPHSPDSTNLTPRKPSIIEAIRIMTELPENMRGSDLKKLLNESSNPHLPNLINIAKRAGRKTALSPTLSLDEGAYDLEEEGDEASEQTPVKGEHDFLPEPQETSFATAVREVFASYFVEHFANYENFIIMPKQSYDQWKKNREQFQNFDKTAFLSDQPTNYRAFYAAFVESSLFMQFVDQKIVTIWEPEKADHSLRLFDARVEQYRDKSGLAKLPTTPGPKSADSDSGEADSFFDLSGEVINEMAPQPHLLAGPTATTTLSATASNTNSNRESHGGFPQLDSNLLQVHSSDLEKVPQPSPEMTGYRRSVDHFGLRGSGSDSKLSVITASPAAVHRLRSSRSSGSSGFGFSSHSHAKFVSQLMRESRLRVKHMLGNTGESANTIEENTHIAYLCDLLERIWGHGLKKRESKSPLWAHLMAYAESEGKEEFQSRKAASVARGPAAETSPDRLRRPHFTSSLSSIAMASTASSNTSGDDSPRSSQNLKAHFRRKKFQSPQLRARLESILQPPPSSLVEDLLTVHNMHELKTDVGRARAWVRLALEKKALSRHLSKLLTHDELLSRRYREYAFVRTEEEREQFLYHLLTLTARDFSCFTTGFHSGTMNYRVLVVGEGKHFGLSTACLYVTLAGEYGVTDTLEMPRGEYQTETTCHNVGPLTCMRIGHDNSGLTPSLFVEMVLVHNTTTGQIYRFNCGRWFARSEDDSSVERLLIAERVPQTIAKSGTMSALNVDSILPSSPSRRRASRREHEERTDLDVKLELKMVMDKIRTLSMGKNKEITQEMLQLIHGPKGFINCMEQVFQTGFRSSRKFQKKLFIWDLLEKVQEQLVVSETVQPITFEVGVRSTSGTERGNSTSPDSEMHCQQMFLNAISRINSNNPNVGKDEKAMRFFCLGLRDDLLAGWVILVSQSPVIQSLYEVHSFLRDPELLQNLIDALQLTQSVSIRLEPLFIQGL